MDDFKILIGNMLEQLDTLLPQSVDNIVTDPPYELNFMGKGWDNAGVSFNAETWKKCFRVLKPGGYLLAFGGSRTYHRIACAIEDAGFEIRDTIMWLYGSGFPKSMNIGVAIDKRNGVESPVIGVGKSGSGETHIRTMKNELQTGGYSFGGEYAIRDAQNEWKGWGTCLKPAFEPIIVARKPITTSLLENIVDFGVGALNIDECRIPTDDNLGGGAYSNNNDYMQNEIFGTYKKLNPEDYEQPSGRFPSNVILTYDDTDYEEVCGGFPNSKGMSSQNLYTTTSKYGGNSLNESSTPRINGFQQGYNDSGSASRYYYCAKASSKDRNEGLEYFEDKVKVFNGKSDNSSKDIKDVEKRFTTVMKNNHPTVKPTELMQYLVRLVAPKGSTILDPFMGSGSTGKAVMFENRERNANYKFIGVELSPEYAEIAKARILFAKGFVIEKKDVETNEVVIRKQAHTNRLF